MRKGTRPLDGLGEVGGELFELIPRFGVLHGSQVEASLQDEHFLAKAVVQFVREALPLGLLRFDEVSGEFFLEAGAFGDGVDAIENSERNREEEKDWNRDSERGCLKPLRLDDDGERRAFLVPYAILVRPDHLEAIFSRWQALVGREAAVPDIHPIVVVARQPIAIGDLVRIGEIDADILDLQAVRIGGEDYGCIRIELLPEIVNLDVFNEDGKRLDVVFTLIPVGGIIGGGTTIRRYPDPVSAVFENRRRGKRWRARKAGHRPGRTVVVWGGVLRGTRWTTNARLRAGRSG